MFQPQPWSDRLAAEYCLAKPPITSRALLKAGAEHGTAWLGVPAVGQTAMFFPILTTGAEVTGHVAVHLTGGRFPVFRGGVRQEPRKSQTLQGSTGGLLGLAGVRGLKDAKVVWKVEGITDLLALMSIERPTGVVVLTTSGGAGHRPSVDILAALAGKVCYIVGDADTAGQAGAAMWAGALAGRASVHNVRLPYEIVPKHGKDLRDFLVAGHGYKDLIALADAGDKRPK
jgi:hypothetical protein